MGEKTIYVPSEVLILNSGIADKVAPTPRSLDEIDRIRDIKGATEPIRWELGLGNLDDRSGPTHETYDSKIILVIKDETEKDRPFVTISLYNWDQEASVTLEITKDRTQVTRTTPENWALFKRALLVSYLTHSHLSVYRHHFTLPGTEYGNEFAVLFQASLIDPTKMGLEKMFALEEPKIVHPGEIQPVARLKDEGLVVVNYGLSLNEIVERKEF
ncbi:hypothetical protein ACFL2V_14780 [Pseudomonadota bacterium]